MGTHPIFESDFDCLTDMGAGQSKTETVYSRYEKENELLPNLKITPSVIERLNQAQNPASGPSYEAIEEEKQRLQHQHQQMAQQMHHQYEKQLMEQEEIYKAKLAAANADSESRAQQIEQMAEKVSMLELGADSDTVKFDEQMQQLKAEYESKMEAAREETANFEAQLELAQSESEKIKAEFEAKILENQQASTDAQSLNAASLQEAILEQKKHAEKMIRDASEKIAEERRAFVEAQVEEKAKMIEKTKKFFSPNETKNICGDITAQVAKCYLENPKNTMLCAELVRDLQACVAPEKQNYLLKQKNLIS